MKHLVHKLAVIICLAVIAGCGTMKGIGEDLSSLGGIISDGSDHYKEAVGKNPPGSKMKSEAE